jgi:hypothetical protein
MSDLLAGRYLPPGLLLVLISVRGLIDHRAIVQLEVLGQMENVITSSGIEPATFRYVELCLNQLRYRVPTLVSELH